MTKLKKWEIEYDPNLVCSECNKNESIHYNYTCFHNGEIRRNDDNVFWGVDEPGVWCRSCDMEDEMVEPKNTPTILTLILKLSHALKEMTRYHSRIFAKKSGVNSMNYPK